MQGGGGARDLLFTADGWPPYFVWFFDQLPWGPGRPGEVPLSLGGLSGAAVWNSFTLLTFTLSQNITFARKIKCPTAKRQEFPPRGFEKL